VLVDSGDAVERVWRAWAVVARVAPHLHTTEEIDRIERLHAETGGRSLPGAAELLARADAVVTSCSAPLAAARLRAAGLATPAVLITADATARGKPYPDPYLAAADRSAPTRPSAW
jgi:sugar-phosphatase